MKSVRREAERQFGSGIEEKAKSEPRMFHSHIRRKMKVNDQVIRLEKRGGEITKNDKSVKCWTNVFDRSPQRKKEKRDTIHQNVMDTKHKRKKKLLLMEMYTSKLM